MPKILRYYLESESMAMVPHGAGGSSVSMSYPVLSPVSYTVSHPVLEGKPNANHVRARIRNSRTHRLYNWTSSHNARNK
jgi:hypothetical protein